MKTKVMMIGLIGVVLTAGVVFAATSMQMKCHNKECGFETRLVLGPTMTRDSITGYCRKCEKFVSLGWRYRNLDGSDDGIEARPEPIGEIWDSTTGKIAPVYACPDCSSAFCQIKTHSELKHCPKCNEPQFRVDESADVIAVD